MANKTLESTVLLLVANLLEKDTGYFYVTEVSQIEE